MCTRALSGSCNNFGDIFKWLKVKSMEWKGVNLKESTSYGQLSHVSTTHLPCRYCSLLALSVGLHVLRSGATY